jgi:HPr kinase/phosphorylase
VLERRISRIVTLEPPVIIVADDCPPPDRWWPCAIAPRSRCSSPGESAGHVIDVLRAYLASSSPSAPRATACSWTSSAWACC